MRRTSTMACAAGEDQKYPHTTGPRARKNWATRAVADYVADVQARPQCQPTCMSQVHSYVQIGCRACQGKAGFSNVMRCRKASEGSE